MALVAGCNEADDGGADEGGVAACPVTEDPDAEPCGTFLDSDEGCDGSGGESGGECDEITAANNDAVVACVAGAAADGVPFVVGHEYFRNGGQYDTLRTHHVGANGDAWNRYSGYSDLCTVEETTVQRGISLAELSQCTAWSCIETELAGVETVETCENSTNCDGV